jgi:RNA polymerase sigma factor (sigma-70 family)
MSTAFVDGSVDRFDDEPPGPDSDAELIGRVRAGDRAAYGLLWSRHERAAHRLAARLANPSGADDVVSEAFLRIFRLLKDGGGPDDTFRPYLLSTVRRITIDYGVRYHNRVIPTGDANDLDTGEPASAAGDVALRNADRAIARTAWESLPVAQRTLLWHLVVEQETPAQVAPLLGVSPNGVSSRAVRAKERLRQAFLERHLALADNAACQRTHGNLAGYVRGALSRREHFAVGRHVRDCAGCQAALAEVRDVNRMMRAVVAPLLLGGAWAAREYFAAAGLAATSTTTAASPPPAGATGATATGPAHAAGPTGLSMTGIVAGVAGVAAAAAVIATVVVTQSSGRQRPAGVAVVPGAPTAPSTASAPGSPSASAGPTTSRVPPTTSGPTTPPAAPSASRPNQDAGAGAARSGPTALPPTSTPDQAPSADPSATKHAQPTPSRSSTSEPPTPPAPVPVQIVSDTFARAVSNGWGRAGQGGAYTLLGGATASVGGGAARAVDIPSGHRLEGALTTIRSADTRVRAAFRVPRIPTTGNGIWLDLGVRAVSPGQRYYVKVRVAPGGRVYLSFSRLDNISTEVILDPEVDTGVRLTAGQVIHVEADVVGSGTIRFAGKVWTGANPPSTWQATASDSSAQRLSAPGYLSVYLYVSRATPAMSADVLALQAWSLPG